MSRIGYIYRLTCVNPTIQERYVGSCWDTHKRNTKHKSSCHNTKSKKCCDHAFPFNANLQKHFTTNKHKQTQQTYDFLSEIDNSCIF